METEKIIQLWLNAEEELRCGNDEKCLELKEEFQEKFSLLSLEHKKEVNEYLESVGA